MPIGASLDGLKLVQTLMANLKLHFLKFGKWKNLRATEGWAVLQHHAVLRTTITLYPPTNSESATLPRLLVDLKQGSFFSLRPQDVDLSAFIPKWFSGNIYDIPHASLHVVDLPSPPSLNVPTKYDLFISGDYEIRLFGDPLVKESDVPVQQIYLSLGLQNTEEHLVRHSSGDVVSDFVAGFSFGQAIGVGVQSIDGWWTVNGLEMGHQIPGLSLVVQDGFTIAPSQTRVVPVIIKQTLPFYGDSLEFTLLLTSDRASKNLSVSIPLVHHDMKTVGSISIKASYFFASSMPTAFIAISPPSRSTIKKAPPIMALHGAGVDILGDGRFVIDAFPNNKEGWLVVPTGRTSWGLDWHGPSTDDAWASLEALSKISREEIRGLPESWIIPCNSRVIIVGHSNGGQGTWYVASRYPDRILAAAPASAYIKSQAYVPWTLARHAHFIDPILRSILDSSLTPDDNDLHLSNLVDTPILAVHGGDDENVPVWHTREAISTLKSWYPSANISYKEDPRKGHWYPDVLNNAVVDAFLGQVMSSSIDQTRSEEFTLTVTTPRSDGSLRGWNINQVAVPGRLRVRKISNRKYEVEPSNVSIFTVPIHDGPVEILIDDIVVQISENFIDRVSTQVRQATSGNWENLIGAGMELDYFTIKSDDTAPESRERPLVIVIPKRSGRDDLLAALRLAHVLNVYHALDAEIVTEETALLWNRSGKWPIGNVVFIGHPSSTFAQEVLKPEAAKTDARIVDSHLYFGNKKFAKAGQGALFLHPHPIAVADGHGDRQSLMLFMLYTDKSALEKLVRLFPFRTGVGVPDWLVVGEKMDSFGAGGVEAAGVWNNDWKLSESMSWFRR
uniref:Peptidase S9 prolyl oligopeptidase catalytic domain-containing protein n=1 Tax=Psilocybe cubensis TaxID=181762 RepID=A0A8H8CMV3_PSICU